MHIRDKYRRETNLEPYTDKPKNVLIKEFNEDYVNWLENKIKYSDNKMIIEKNDKIIQDNEYYRLVVNTEKHTNHEIEIDEHGTLRWVEDKNLRLLLDKGELDINNIVMLFYTLGYDKNSEIYRDFYRKLGYSLNSYWEIFYYGKNNDEADQYQPYKTIIHNQCDKR